MVGGLVGAALVMAVYVIPHHVRMCIASLRRHHAGRPDFDMPPGGGGGGGERESIPLTDVGRVSYQQGNHYMNWLHVPFLL